METQRTEKEIIDYCKSIAGTKYFCRVAKRVYNMYYEHLKNGGELSTNRSSDYYWNTRKHRTDAAKTAEIITAEKNIYYVFCWKVEK